MGGGTKRAEAELLLREALPIERNLFGQDSPEVANTLEHLQEVLKSEGKISEAEDAGREALACRRKHSEDQLALAASLELLANTLVRQSKRDEATPLFREALSIQQKVSGKEHPSVARRLMHLGSSLLEEGKLSEAESALTEALEMRRKLLEAWHPDVAESLESLAIALSHQGKFSEAEPLYRECLAIREKRFPDSWYTFFTRVMLGEALLGQKKYDEAEPLLISGYEGMKQREDKIWSPSEVLTEALNSLARLYEATDRPDKAAEWNQKLELFGREEVERKTAGKL